MCGPVCLSETASVSMYFSPSSGCRYESSEETLHYKSEPLTGPGFVVDPDELSLFNENPMQGPKRREEVHNSNDGNENSITKQT